jgi:hypothetical protein
VVEAGTGDGTGVPADVADESGAVLVEASAGAAVGAASAFSAEAGGGVVSGSVILLFVLTRSSSFFFFLSALLLICLCLFASLSSSDSPSPHNKRSISAGEAVDLDPFFFFAVWFAFLVSAVSLFDIFVAVCGFSFFRLPHELTGRSAKFLRSPRDLYQNLPFLYNGTPTVFSP